ncbi:MAG: O-antigen ligase family protein [Chloroflexi bacterium]|nr:O-antigen ligase family protein [Chloroflexota bacterium]
MTVQRLWQRLLLAILAAVVAALPFYRFGLSLGGQSLAPHEVLLLLAAAVRGARWVAQRRGSGGEGLPGGEAMNLPIVLVLASALLSLLATEYLRLSLRELRTLIVEPLLFWYLCRLTVRSASDVLWLVGALLVSTTVVAILGLVQLVAGGAVTDVQGVRRVLGTYTSPNHFALLLGRALPFWLALGWQLPRWRPWAIAGGLLCAGALGATFSVGGWLASGLALLVVVGLLGGRRLLLALVLAGIVAGAVVFLAAPVERLAGRLDPRQGTSFVRVQLWQTAAQLVAESPLLGIGLDNFLYRYPALMPPGASFEPNLSHPHNLVLQFWLQLGVLGLIALIWLLWRFLRLTWSAARADQGSSAQDGTASSPIQHALAVGALGSMTDFVAHGLVDNGYFLPDMAVIFWLTLAVAVVAGRRPPPAPRSTQDLT